MQKCTFSVGERKSSHRIVTKFCHISVTGKEAKKGSDELVSFVCGFGLFGWGFF